MWPQTPSVTGFAHGDASNRGVRISESPNSACSPSGSPPELHAPTMAEDSSTSLGLWFIFWYLGNYYYTLTNKRALNAAGGKAGCAFGLDPCEPSAPAPPHNSLSLSLSCASGTR